MKRNFSFIATLLILLTSLLSACSSAANPEGAAVEGKEADNAAAAQASASALIREAYPTYSSTFVIDFDGASKWKYQLQTRKSPSLVETNLHLEGVSGELNPGDIRLVTDGTTSWMTGPGTDNECIQYPNNTGMDPSLIYPETLVPLSELPGLTRLVREDSYAGRTSQYYTGGPVTLGGWKDVRLEYRQEKGSKALLQFAMLGSGDDPAFGSGPGTLMATYSIDSLDEQVIEPVSGCEISVPLPASAAKYVRLPGLSSFESAEASAAIAGFYQSQLPQAGWTELEPPSQATATMILSYGRGAEQVEIQIEDSDSGGSLVKLIFLQ
jgi:hypothetical protein